MMGRALVPFKNRREWEAWRRALLQRAVSVDKMMQALIIGVPMAALLVVLYIYSIWPTLGTILFFTTVVFVGYEVLHAGKGALRNTVAEIPLFQVNFPCPHCARSINLSRAWVCGWCFTRYGVIGRTPIQGCTNSICENTRVHDQSGASGDQAAIQCPNCARHVILDPELYHAKQCQMSPYLGVAKDIEDERPPKDTAPAEAVLKTDWFSKI